MSVAQLFCKFWPTECIRMLSGSLFGILFQFICQQALAKFDTLRGCLMVLGWFSSVSNQLDEYAKHAEQAN